MTDKSQPDWHPVLPTAARYGMIVRGDALLAEAP